MSDSKKFEYWQVFDQAQIGMALVSLQGEWLEVNPRFCAMTGYSRDELLGASPQALTHPDDREVDDYFLRGLMTGKGDTTLQKRCIHKDGHTIWMKVSASVVPDHQEEENLVIFTVNDITGLIQTQEALQSASARLHSALSATCTGIWEWNIQEDSVYWSTESEQLWGMRKGEFANNLEQVRSRIHPDDVTRWEADVQRCLQNGELHDIEFRLVHPDNSIHWIHALGEVETNSDGQPVFMRGTVTEVTEQVETRQRLARLESHLKLAQQIAQAGSWEFDVLHDELYWSEEIYRIFGMRPEEFEANLAAFLRNVHPDDREYVQSEYQASLWGKKPYDIEHRIIRKDSAEVRWVHQRCVHVRNERGDVLRSDGVIQDITERKLVEQEVHRLALTDQLTGLANRRHFFRRFGDIMKLADREKMVLSLMLLDLDGFKEVNDKYGHPVGDELLRAVSTRLQHCLRGTDIIARVGGDEFAVLLVNPAEPEGVLHSAERVVDAFSGHFDLEKILNVRLGISIGIANYPEHGKSEEDLIHRADIALYKAKEVGGSTYRFCEPDSSCQSST